jgi:hypothetical protein
LRTFFKWVPPFISQAFAQYTWCCFCAQCAIPVFDGLFSDEDNDGILELLFVCAHWHGLAKFRMHTDQTLGLLDNVTTLLGVKFCHFVKNTCAKFNTRELQREADARARRAAKKQNQKQGKTSDATGALSSDQASLVSQQVSTATPKFSTTDLKQPPPPLCH